MPWTGCTLVVYKRDFIAALLPGHSQRQARITQASATLALLSRPHCSEKTRVKTARRRLREGRQPAGWGPHWAGNHQEPRARAQCLPTPGASGPPVSQGCLQPAHGTDRSHLLWGGKLWQDPEARTALDNLKEK